jgi:hypothetical protein
MDRRLVILDVSDPLASGMRSWLRPGSDDTFVTADSAESSAWLSSVTGLDVQSARHLCSQTGMQQSVEEYARQSYADLPFMYRGVDVSPSIEYGLVLALVSALRDIDLCCHVWRLRTSGATWNQAVILTDRRRTRGLARCLQSAAGTRRVRVVRRPQRRYLDAMLEPPRPTREPLVRRAGRHVGSVDSMDGPHAVAVVQRLVRFLESYDDRQDSPAILSVPDGVWGLLFEYVSLQGPWRAMHMRRRARRSASSACVTAAAYLEGVQDCLSSADVGHLCRDYLHPLCASGLLRGVFGVEAVLSRASTSGLSGLLVWNDVLPQHRGMVDAARHIGVRTAMWQHGVFALRTVHDRPRVDVVAVWGETSRRWLLAAGFPDARIRAVGAPSIAPTTVVSGGARRDRKTRVLYTSEGHAGIRLAEDLTEGARTLHLVAVASSAADCALTAKAHPIEATRAWGGGMRALGHDLRFCLSTPIPELLRDADVMISRTSTTALEARLSGLPVLLLDDGDEGRENPYANLEGVRVVSGFTTLVEALEELRTSGRLAVRGEDVGRTVALSDVICATGASAGSRLRDLVERELMGESCGPS